MGFPRCSAGSGARRSTVEAGAADRRVWDGTGLDWDWRQQSCQGTTGRARRDGDKIGGETLYGKVEGDAVQLRNVGAPKKAMGWGQAKPKADGRTADDRPIEYPNAGAEMELTGLLTARSGCSALL